MAAKYITVEGPIGAGKTNLAKMLAAHYHGRLVLEEHETNPFLAGFYHDRRRYAFQTQVFFLLSRFKQQQELLSGELLNPYVITDYFFEKDKIFAGLNLDRDELTLYNHVALLLEKNIPRPDLVIYLTAPAEMLLERIKRRGRHYEKSLDLDYIEAVKEAYSRYFFHYHQTPLLVINTEHVNFANEPDQFEYLVKRLENLKSGTNYLVPSGRNQHGR